MTHLNYQTPKPADPVSTLIPYRNVPALISYYLGIFSFIPCLGLLLAVPAVVLGIIGLRRAAQYPEAKGKVHAIVGLVCGAVFGLVNLAGIVIVPLGILAR